MIVSFNYEGTIIRGTLLETSIDDEGELVKKIKLSHKDGVPTKPSTVEYTGPVLALVGSES